MKAPTNPTSLRRGIAIGTLFSICLLFLLERGPYRAIRFAQAYDFSTVYASARCWIKGENLYDRTELKKELVEARAPARLVYQQDLNPSVYLVTAMPFLALVAWLPWQAANIAWCLLSLAFFAASLVAILRHANLSPAGKWIFASVSLVFCPTYVGLLRGNPSVLSISLTALAVCSSLDRRPWMSGFLLGTALCLKPQIALCAVCALVVWKCWQSLAVGFGMLGAAAIAGVLRASSLAHAWQWLQSERQNLAVAFAPGGPSDPSPSSNASFQFLNAQTLAAYLIENPLFRDVAAWIFAAVLLILYLRLRKKAGAVSPWRDLAFFCPVTILITYHRYYDAQLFLLLIPFLVAMWKTRDRKGTIFLGICLLALAFPDQSVFAKLLGPEATTPSLLQLVFVRQQPMAVVAIALILVFSWQRETKTSAHRACGIPRPSRRVRRLDPPRT